MKEYKIKERLHIFKKLKSIEIDLIAIGFAYMNTDERKWERIKKARMLLIDVLNEVYKELEEAGAFKRKEGRNGKEDESKKEEKSEKEGNN